MMESNHRPFIYKINALTTELMAGTMWVTHTIIAHATRTVKPTRLRDRQPWHLPSGHNAGCDIRPLGYAPEHTCRLDRRQPSQLHPQST